MARIEKEALDVLRVRNRPANSTHMSVYIRRSRRTCPAVFQSIKSGFSCSIVFLAPRPIKSFDRAGAVDGNTIRMAIVDESRQIVLTQTQSMSVPPPPFDYLLYVVVVHCFVFF